MRKYKYGGLFFQGANNMQHKRFIFFVPFFVKEWRAGTDRRKQRQKWKRWKRRIRTGGQRMKTQTLRSKRIIPSPSSRVRPSLLSLRLLVSFVCSRSYRRERCPAVLVVRCQLLTESNWMPSCLSGTPLTFCVVCFLSRFIKVAL